MELKQRLRDWWRGYTVADLRSLQAKMRQPRKPGEVVLITRAEMRALVYAVPEREVGLQIGREP